MIDPDSLRHARWLVAFLALLVVGVAGFPTTATEASSATQVTVSAPAAAIAPGQEFTASVEVVPGRAIAGVQFDLSFDPSLVAVNSVREGNLLNQNGATAFFNSGTIDNQAGIVTGTFGVVTTPGATVSTGGTFALITLSARAGKGDCPLSLSNVVVSDADGSAVAISVIDSTVRVDQAPVLNAIGSKNIKEGAMLTFTVSASDADGDPLMFSASNLPYGATFDAATRTFCWTPSLRQAGVYSGVRFQVSDGEMTDQEDITITVTDEVAPVLNAVGNKSVSEGATLSFTISGSDANGDLLVYTVSNLPGGATFDASTKTFLWQPGYGQAGTYAGVRFQVSDGQMADYEDITITVSNSLRPDVNDDGYVNVLDMIRVGQHWNLSGTAGWIREDINEDGTVNVLDATLIGQNWTG